MSDFPPEGVARWMSRSIGGAEAKTEKLRRSLNEGAVRVQQVVQRLVLAVEGVLACVWTLHCNSLPFPSLSFSKTASGGGGVGRRSTEAATRSRTPAMDSPANPNIHTIVKAQIVFLLSTLTEENFERNQVEIRSVSAPGHRCAICAREQRTVY